MAFLNLDAGELESETDALYAMVDVLSCACTGHAGDLASMTRVAKFCSRPNHALGAHPSYPDREGFGRGPMQIDPQQLAVEIAAQCRG